MINFRIPVNARLIQWDHSFGQDGSLMQIPQFDDRKKTFGQDWFGLEPLWKSAKGKLVRTYAKQHGCAIVIPLAAAAAQIDPTAVGDKARFYFRVGRAQDD